ncbi:beta,beta-carotene 15,15'-dioxygenase-like [Penaeus japonicus]|uniref:beta,beta-carotene 15,15'-dioxygenase-like n=1 Tax=Penaeus japonicus TaxID=27405 RepID=UPI001C715E75|nr:beta,beta-carotene 15,15'-dioxygenase-like [Penaeus japonicus]
MDLFCDNFKNAQEHPDPVPGRVIGEIPPWLSGTFLRVGPGKFDLGDFTLNHWLDGMAILYKFSIGDGKVTFRSKYLKSDAYKKACVAGRPVFTEFGTHSFPDPCKNIFSRMFSNFDCHAMTDNASNNAFCVEDQVFVASETCFVRKVDPVTLETREKVDLNKLVSVNFASSHPLRDREGATYNLGGSFTSGLKYHILKIPQCRDTRGGSDPWHNTRIVGTIPSSFRASFSYYHSFGMSEEHLLFLEQPLLVNTLKLATSQIKSRAMHDCMEWHPQEKVKFHLLHKSTGEMVKVKYMCDEPFFTFHHVNAYEVKGHLVADIITYPSPEILDKFYLNKIRAKDFDVKDAPQMQRFILPLLADLQGKPEGEELVSLPGAKASAKIRKDSSGGLYVSLTPVNVGRAGFEMPVVNPKYVGAPYRYVFATGGYDTGFYKNAVCKVDVESGRSQVWRGLEHQYTSEPVFVPAPDAEDEDDGVVLVSVVDVRPDFPDCLLVLDGRTMDELARAEVDGPVPNGLHGTFIPDKL